jgi:hypothetical protein
MKILTLEIAGHLLQQETGPQAQVGDQVKMFLDRAANPELPAFAFGIIQPPIKKTRCDEYTQYRILYDESGMAGNYLRPDDVLYTDLVPALDLETVRAIAAEGLLQGNIDAHTARTDNPHATTKAQVGLALVDNTSDISKPISTVTQNALNLKAPIINTPVAVATLPAAGSNAGSTRFVNNASVVAAGNFGTVVAAGGVNVVPVYSDGTNWRIG